MPHFLPVSTTCDNRTNRFALAWQLGAAVVCWYSDYVVVVRFPAPCALRPEASAPNVADIGESDGRLQAEMREVGRVPCTYLKFTIASGWGDFVTVHNVAVEGARM
jgi:hypothetical protein